MSLSLSVVARANPGIKGALDDDALDHESASTFINTYSETRGLSFRTSADEVASYRTVQDQADAFHGKSIEFTPEVRAEWHRLLDDRLDEVQADPAALEQITARQWQMGSKDEDGNPQVTDLHSLALKLKVERTEPDWATVVQAVSRSSEPAKITPVKTSARSRKPKDKIAVILPDPQIGYRHHIDTGEMDEFQDELAMNVALQIIKDVAPDLILNLGDFLDLPAFGRYEQEPAFAQTTQASIDRGHTFLAEQRVCSPNASIVVLEGNHDRRLQKMILNNTAAAWGLRRAGEVSKYTVLSVPYMCNFEAFEVEYVPGYPANKYWINERLKAIHGLKVRSGGSTARAVSDDETTSTIFGHIHRIESQYRTVNVYGGMRTRFAHTPGCLCKIDGTVPSVKGSTDLSGRPVENYEDWQQGLSIVEYREGDSPFNLHSLFINTADGYTTWLNGKHYTPTNQHSPIQ